jgi:hypothetical protein
MERTTYLQDHIDDKKLAVPFSMLSPASATGLMGLSFS